MERRGTFDQIRILGKLLARSLSIRMGGFKKYGPIALDDARLVVHPNSSS
jgi:hypothetical protein